MNNQDGAKVEKIPLSQRPVGKWGCGIICLMAGFFLLAMFSQSQVIIEVPYQLAVGWLSFLIHNLGALEMNWEMMGCGLGALVIAVFGLHRLLVWVRDDKGWKWLWTMSVTALMLMLFAASVAMTGIIHQLGWMVREPLTQSNRDHPLTNSTVNAKQMFYLLVEYDLDFDGLPQTLSDLETEGDTKHLASLRFQPGRGKPAEPWIYIRSRDSLLSDEDSSLEGGEEDDAISSSVLLLSPSKIGKRWVVLFYEGSVKQLTTEELLESCPELPSKLPSLFDH